MNFLDDTAYISKKLKLGKNTLPKSFEDDGLDKLLKSLDKPTKSGKAQAEPVRERGQRTKKAAVKVKHEQQVHDVDAAVVQKETTTGAHLLQRKIKGQLNRYVFFLAG